MKIYFTTACFCLLMFFCFYKFAVAKTPQERFEEMKQIQQAADTTIGFYGKIKDQNGQPITGAKVTAHLTHFGSNEMYFIAVDDVSTVTDNNGLFKFNGLTGKKIFINTIDKFGYEFVDNNTRVSFQYSGVSEDLKFKPDPNNPIVFILHKKNDPGLVVLNDCRMILKPIWEGFEIDVFKGFPDPLTKVIKAKVKSDIVVSILPAQGQDFFNVEIAAMGGETNGLVEQAGEVHVAPDSGYQSTITYTITKGQETKKTIYHKGRSDKVYSRLDMSLRPIDKGVRVEANFFTNIEGSKNTEWDLEYTIKQLGIITGKNIRYGSDDFNNAFENILKNTIQRIP